MIEPSGCTAKPPAPGTTDDQPQDGSPAALSLPAFCQAVLDLSRSADAVEVTSSKAFAKLKSVIQEGVRQTVTDLREEVSYWEVAARHLRDLTRSPYLALDGEAHHLLANLDRQRAAAEKLIAALESLTDVSRELSGGTLPPLLSCLRPQPGIAGLGLLDDGVGGSDVPEQSGSVSVVPQAKPAGRESENAAHPGQASVAQLTALFEQAEVCRQRNDLATAEDLYNAVIQLDRRFGPAYRCRGRVRILRGEGSLAAEDLTDALRLCGREASAYWWRGDANSLCQRYAEAIDDYSQALSLNADLEVVRYNRAVALRKAGDLDRALDELNQLVAIRPDHGPLYLNRGRIYLARGNAARAAAEFRRALRCHPELQKARLLLAEAEVILDREQAESVPGTQPGRRDPTTASAAEVESSFRGSNPDCGNPLTGQGVSDRRPDGRRAPEDVTGARVIPPAPEAGSECHLPFACPRCGHASFVRWDRLQMGKILACPLCKTTFTTRKDGSLTEVRRNSSGRWIDVAARAEKRARTWSRRRRILAGLTAAVLFLVFTLGSPAVYNGWSQSAEASLPVELEPRAELFAMAWLSDDLRMMRRLTDPVLDRSLFGWHRQHPAPPGYAPDTPDLPVTIKVEVLSRQAAVAVLAVQITGGYQATGESVLKLELAWVERGQQWFFQPISPHATYAHRRP